MYRSTRGKTLESFDIMEVSGMTSAVGLQMVWDIFGGVFDKARTDKFDEAADN